MRSLVSVSLCLLLLCCSCASSITRGYRKGETVTVGKEQLPPMIDASDRLCKYNMTIDFMRKHFSGLLLVKQSEAGTYRMLFSTHFGLSLFDFEIGRDSLVVHHCIEPLNKKRILDLFSRDFSVLLGLPVQAVKMVVVYDTSGCMQEIRLGSGLRKTTFRSITDSTGVDVIRIRHTGLRLSIGLDGLD